MVKRAAPSQWVTWRTYGPDKRAAAYATASQLRTGKVAALNDVKVTSRVTGTGTGYAVEVARQQQGGAQ